MKIILSRVPAHTLRRGDRFMARYRCGWEGQSDYITLRVVDAHEVALYDGRTREFIGNGLFPEGNVWKITGAKR